MELVDPKTLKPHPLNETIYAAPGADETWKSFVDSVQKNGIIQAIQARPSGRIMVGHRRHAAALQLGLEAVKVEYINPPEGWAGTEDEWELYTLIHSNRFRRKSFSEQMREAEHLERIERSLASARQGVRTDLGEAAPAAAGLTRDKVGEALGVSGRQYAVMREVWANRTNPHIAARIAKIDGGQGSVSGAYNLLLEAKRDTTDFQARVYDKWEFGGLNPKYGQPHPGAIPGDILENVLWMYTMIGDLVVDPFAGGGVTIDVCNAWNRRVIGMDIDPRRADIERHNIMEGFPGSAKGANLVFLDPPYWNMVAEDYSKDGVASLSIAEFMKFMKKLAIDCYNTVDEATGVTAIIMMKQHFRLPVGLDMVDWPFLCVKWFTDAGFRYSNRIVNVWPTSLWSPSQVVLAKETKRLLPICGDLLIFRRVPDA